jgi:hypothetical protein
MEPNPLKNRAMHEGEDPSYRNGFINLILSVMKITCQCHLSSTLEHKPQVQWLYNQAPM